MRSWNVWLTALGTAALLSTTGVASAAEHSTATGNSVAAAKAKGPGEINTVSTMANSVQPKTPPPNKTCGFFKITGRGVWNFTSRGGQKIWIDVINSSLAPVNISAQQVSGEVGTNLYNGVLGINESTTFTATLFGQEPVTYSDLRFAVDGPSIGTIGVRVRSYIC
ncbi:hypothetical protein OG895_18490 [Streptomyces sp. NBC_00201]|uniref:hypothetical protein n=1 Tax=Streptomyces sp. NBC_00201 TaxID=2975679 RepID=UPI00225087AB|nr:hypothetical protein [Streptomyces sp. NBC_00201]MCX5247183.1 hypothetical protein [Streptomyces sp. NBC_00201]